VRVAGDLVDHVVSAAWTLGYLQPGRMETQYEDEEDAADAQAAAMFE
jgi:hypothetical protein